MSGIMQMLLAAVQRVTDPFFEYVTLLLPGNGTNGAQNNTFLDSSTNNFTITRNGNTTQGTFSPFSQTGWGNYFDGTGDALTVADNAALDMGSSDFTIECWAYLTTTGSDYGIVSKWNQWGTAGTNSYLLYYSSAGNLEFLVSTGGTIGDIVLSSAATLRNTWVHIAAVRSGSNFALFANGTRLATASSASSVYDSTQLLRIGEIRSSVANFPGYLSNVRIVKGTAVYDPTQASITVPTAPLTAITNTQLLTCQSNRFIDNSTNAFTITRNGDVSVQAFSPFNPTAAWSAATNGGSGYFDGSGDYLTAPSDAAWTFGTGDFTVEAWIYQTGSLANYKTIAGNIQNGSDTTWYIFVSSTGTLRFQSWNLVPLSSTATLNLNSWNHVVAVRSGTDGALFLNGTRVATASSFTQNFSTNATLYIGRSNPDNVDWTGYISGLRIVKGSAVYSPSSTTITIPTAPPTAVTNTQLLCNFTNAGIYDATSKNDLETVGNAQISTTQSKFGGSSMYFDGTDDRLVAPSNIDVAIGTADFTIEGWFYTASPATNRGLFQISTTVGGLEAGNTNNLAVYCSSSVLGVYYASTFKAGTTSISANTWTHFALVRTGGSTKLYVNGTADSGFGTNADTQNYTGKNVCVGGYFSTAYLWSGYIQDFRITRGYARYTSNFTAPTAAFPLL